MKYFITFGNNRFKNQILNLKQQAESTGWFDKIITETPDSINEFYQIHQNFINSNDRGYGYWIWKPYIIYKLLLNINDNDYIFYSDAGSSVLPHKYNRLLEYIDILDSTDRPILTFSSQYLEKNFQKLLTLNYFNLSNNIDFLNSYQVESGIVICKKNNFVINFIKNWLDLCIINNYKLLIDSNGDNENEHFIEHRHDQSILSILCKINKISIICCNEAYGSGPFFSSRLTDDLPRKFAPDLFRTDIRYDETKHFTWNEWLNDYPDSRFNYDLLLSLYINNKNV